MSPARQTAERWKPAVGVRTQLTAASVLWTCVGLGLGTAGILWCVGAGDAWYFVALGVAVGLAKAWFIIAPVARRNAARIIERGDGKCLGGFLSWKSWAFVAGMMSLGAVLRHSAIPRSVLGVLYVAIGAALLTGALPLWRSALSQPIGRT
ncbi:MAG: hypothetical protein QM765_22165 [Myxococcales bacterium]